MKLKKIVILVISIFLISILYINYNGLKKYSKTIKFNSNDINITVYSKDKNILNKIEQIYRKYDNNSLYDIKHNFSSEEYLKLDENFYKLINKGLELYEKSNNTIDISKGNLKELLNSYKILNKAPDNLELKLASNRDIKDIILKDGYIKNNHININVDDYIESYILINVEKLLRKEKINNYFINSDKSILVGSNFNKKYNILVSLDDNNYELVKANNKYIITKKNVYDYKNNKYYDNYKSITIITENQEKSLYMANLLYSYSIEEGLNIINKEKDVEALWYTSDNKKITSDGFKKYH